MSFIFWILSVFTYDTKKQKNENKKNKLKTAKFKIMYILFLSVYVQIVIFIDRKFALHEVKGCKWSLLLFVKKKNWKYNYVLLWSLLHINAIFLVFKWA